MPISKAVIDQFQVDIKKLVARLESEEWQFANALFFEAFDDLPADWRAVANEYGAGLSAIQKWRQSGRSARAMQDAYEAARRKVEQKYYLTLNPLDLNFIEL